MNDYSFKNKWVILDTNILSQMAKEKRADIFKPVFEFLKENDCQIFLIDSTYFELIAFAGNKKDYNFLNNWINNFPILVSKKEDVEKAGLISSYYKNSDPQLNPKQISYCDCLHAAMIAKYKDRVFIVTTDIHDYPISIFDLSKLMIVEDNKKALIVGFITYNKDKFLKAEDNFNKSA